MEDSKKGGSPNSQERWTYPCKMCLSKIQNSPIGPSQGENCWEIAEKKVMGKSKKTSFSGRDIRNIIRQKVVELFPFFRFHNSCLT